MILVILLIMVSVAAAAVAVPLLRGRDALRPDPTAAVARRQFAEAEPAADAARRLLAEADAAPRLSRALGRGARFILTGAVVAVLVVGTVGLYLLVGQPELAGTAPAAATVGAAPNLTAELEQRVLSAPNDPAGWNRLGVAYGKQNRFSDAAMVFARAAKLQPAEASYASAEGEALTEAAKGQVTTGAREAFRAALTADPSDPRARYYLALAKDQAGDHAGARADWDILIRSAPPDAPWLSQVKAYVARARVRTGNQ